jgi:branched-chain amino acid transport system ATP-binding protein
VSLELQAVSAGYGSGDVLSGISLTVKPGEIVALLGANGAGKSTLLKAISGLIQLSNGKISFQGAEIERLAVAERVRLGLVHVPEGRQIFSGMSVAQNLLLGGYVRRGDSGDTHRMSEVLGAFPDLSGRLQDVAGNLSGGQQQMLAIGRGLMARPLLIMLDEPSLGLAPKLVTEIFKLVSGLRDRGIAILLSEQNAQLALAVSDRGYVLENGRVALEGTGRELLHSKDVAEKYLGVGAGIETASNPATSELAARLRALMGRAS